MHGYGYLKLGCVPHVHPISGDHTQLVLLNINRCLQVLDPC